MSKFNDLRWNADTQRLEFADGEPIGARTVEQARADRRERRVTIQAVQHLTERAEADNSAHNALIGLDEDLRQDDSRARQGMGLAPVPPRIDPAARALLAEYLSTH